MSSTLAPNNLEFSANKAASLDADKAFLARATTFSASTSVKSSGILGTDCRVSKD